MHASVIKINYKRNYRQRFHIHYYYFLCCSVYRPAREGLGGTGWPPLCGPKGKACPGSLAPYPVPAPDFSLASSHTQAREKVLLRFVKIHFSYNSHTNTPCTRQYCLGCRLASEKVNYKTLMIHEEVCEIVRISLSRHRRGRRGWSSTIYGRFYVWTVAMNASTRVRFCAKRSGGVLTTKSETTRDTTDILSTTNHQLLQLLHDDSNAHEPLLYAISTCMYVNMRARGHTPCAYTQSLNYFQIKILPVDRPVKQVSKINCKI